MLFLKPKSSTGRLACCHHFRRADGSLDPSIMSAANVVVVSISNQYTLITPRAFNASAMARSVLAPARCISLMIGSTLAALTRACLLWVSRYRIEVDRISPVLVRSSHHSDVAGRLDDLVGDVPC